ncbi:hypothetical protein BS50DRAFT_284691 [Corynespora cassiicola Philippines]|uniref:Uncharacterized protein n=1 Tax=Corynespora cassiicola Philippines TaxID=1448308 RepID=A0A2T2P1Z5_CORCC|nr:hypothetical protein BS50DRAFT_284691 [Corynespora cassiicola Philippines]
MVEELVWTFSVSWRQYLDRRSILRDIYMWHNCERNVRYRRSPRFGKYQKASSIATGGVQRPLKRLRNKRPQCISYSWTLFVRGELFPGDVAASYSHAQVARYDGGGVDTQARCLAGGHVPVEQLHAWMRIVSIATRHPGWRYTYASLEAREAYRTRIYGRATEKIARLI